MFRYTKMELAEMAEKLNFVRDTLEKVIRLTEVLDYLNGHWATKGKLALKGGTAINLIVFDLPRLSVDIDLDYYGDESREVMLRRRNEITDNLIDFMKKQGYEKYENGCRSRHSLDSFVFAYKNSGGVRDNLKIEINYSLRKHLFELDSKLCIFGDEVRTSNEILVLKPMELFAAKINALLSRAAARDLYDVNNAIEANLFSGEQEREVLRKSIVFYTAVSQEIIPEGYAVENIDKITTRKIKSDLVPVIHKKKFIELVKMQKVVKEYLSGLLVLNDSENEFLRLFKKKIYKPELLFDDNDILERIKDHPMILWKLQNHS